jgi:hypothetical protein
MPFPEKDRWHIVCRLVPNVYARNGGYACDIGCFKLTSYPPEGEMVSKKNYKGVWFRKDFTPQLSIEGAWNLPTLNELRFTWNKCRKSMSGNIKGLLLTSSLLLTFAGCWVKTSLKNGWKSLRRK